MLWNYSGGVGAWVPKDRGSTQRNDVDKSVKEETFGHIKEWADVAAGVRLLRSLLRKAYRGGVEHHALLGLIADAVNSLHFELGYIPDTEDWRGIRQIQKIIDPSKLGHRPERNDMDTMAVGSDLLPSRKSRQRHSLWMRHPDHRTDQDIYIDHIGRTYTVPPRS